MCKEKEDGNREVYIGKALGGAEMPTYQKVTRAAARRLYNVGKAVTLYPCKCGPESQWVQGVTVTKYSGVPFDAAVYEFETYNCLEPELGQHAAFFA